MAQYEVKVVIEDGNGTKRSSHLTVEASSGGAARAIVEAQYRNVHIISTNKKSD